MRLLANFVKNKLKSNDEWSVIGLQEIITCNWKRKFKISLSFQISNGLDYFYSNKLLGQVNHWLEEDWEAHLMINNNVNERFNLCLFLFPFGLLMAFVY